MKQFAIVLLISAALAATRPALAQSADSNVAEMRRIEHALRNGTLVAVVSVRGGRLAIDYVTPAEAAGRLDARVRQGELSRDAADRLSRMYRELAIATAEYQPSDIATVANSPAPAPAPPQPTPRAQPQRRGPSVIDFAFVDRTYDVVSTDRAMGSDGRRDAHFRLTIDFGDGARLRELAIWRTDAAGSSRAGERWRTSAEAGAWILGVYSSGRALHESYVADVGYFTGPVTFDLYANAEELVTPGHYFMAEIRTDTATFISPPVRIGTATTQSAGTRQETRKPESGSRTAAAVGELLGELAIAIAKQNRSQRGDVPPPARSAQALEAAGCAQSPTFEYGQDRAGSDYRSFELDTPCAAECAEACGDDLNCKAWTYVRPGYQAARARCYLKNGIPAAARLADAISGIAVHYAPPSGNPPAAPSQAGGAASIREFYFVGRDQDLVHADGFGGDGTRDAHFSATVDLGSGVAVREIAVRQTGAGVGTGERWVSSRSDGGYMLGVYERGQPLHRGVAPSLGLVSGVVRLDLFGTGEAAAGEGESFTLNVALEDGRLLTATTRVGTGAVPPPQRSTGHGAELCGSWQWHDRALVTFYGDSRMVASQTNTASREYTERGNWSSLDRTAQRFQVVWSNSRDVVTISPDGRTLQGTTSDGKTFTATRLSPVDICSHWPEGWAGPSSADTSGVRTWSEWFDSDDPDSSGDWETIERFAGRLPCAAPIAVQCRVLGDGRSAREAGQVYQCSMSATQPGGLCLNEKNGGQCLDYEVRFGCP